MISKNLEKKCRDFIDRESLPSAYYDLIKNYYFDLAYWIHSKKTNSCLKVAIQGAQGSGKSTLTSVLKLILEEEFRLTVIQVSLDDFYLSKSKRQDLANKIHPLLRTRGVPGTHDLALLLQFFQSVDKLQKDQPLQIPRFDKSCDDCHQAQIWLCSSSKVDICLMEGWCMGVSPQSEEELRVPCNELEEKEDSDVSWRYFVNEKIKDYQKLFDFFDLWISLKIPSFDCVKKWRLLQEEKLIQKTGHGQSREELMRFIQHFERLTLSLQKSSPKRAHVLIDCSEDHMVKSVLYKK